jgi:ABC-type glycerol-3-phosphate transport system substrate-binding protein
MSKRVLYLLVVLALVLGLTLTACGGTEQATEEPAAEEPAAQEPAAEEPAAEEPEEPMEEETGMDLSGTTVSFWHVYGEGDPRNETLRAMIADFNATNEWGITIEEFDQGDYDSLVNKVNAGLTSGDLPNIAQAYTSDIMDWKSVDAVVDLNQFVYDPDYGLAEEELDAVYPGIFQDGIAPDGTRVNWPITQSANAVVYNYTWAQELGFDSPPSNTAELKEQVCAAAAANSEDDNPDNDGTGGLVWRSTASDFLSLSYAFGGSELNDDGTAYDFTTQPFVDAALFINDLKEAGCAWESESYPNPEQARREALVTFSSIAGAPYYAAAFDDAGNDDEWGFLPFVGPDGKQVTDAFTQAVGILKSSPEEELASWLFIKYFTTPENQAKWVEISGYLPTQTTTEPLLEDYIASEPMYQSLLDLAALGIAEPQTFPAWGSVRNAVGDAAAQLFTVGTDEEAVLAILEQLNSDSAEFVEEVQ